MVGEGVMEKFALMLIQWVQWEGGLEIDFFVHALNGHRHMSYA
jgi:hypothetical protein